MKSRQRERERQSVKDVLGTGKEIAGVTEGRREKLWWNTG